MNRDKNKYSNYHTFRNTAKCRHGHAVVMLIAFVIIVVLFSSIYSCVKFVRSQDHTLANDRWCALIRVGL